jgi:hypothetical protein
MASYLTREDEQNFGPELLDVAIRAARHGLAPELQRLHEENQQLQGQLDSATKLSLDRELDREVPNWREINTDPRFHAWLLTPEPYSGAIRDRLLKDAVAAGDAQRLIRFFQGFVREQGGAGAASATSQPRARQRRSAPDGKPIYTRPQITEMARRRQKGLIDDAAWLRWEYELIAAGREGRIVGALDADGLPRSR